MGLGIGYINVVVMAWLQAHVEPSMLGRVMGLTMLASFGLGPISLAVAGAIVDWSATALFLGAGALVLVTVALRLRDRCPPSPRPLHPLHHHRDSPPRQEAPHDAHPIRPSTAPSSTCPCQTTSDRIADLQADAAATRVAGSPPGPTGPLGRLRDGLGVRLVELGAALVADDAVKRRVIRS